MKDLALKQRSSKIADLVLAGRRDVALRKIQLLLKPAVIGDYYDFGPAKGGGGGFGQVEALHMKTFKSFAGKVLEKEDTFDDGYEESEFRRIMEAFMHHTHANILEVLHTFEDASSYYVVMPQCKGGTLRETVAESGRRSRAQLLLS